MHILVATNNFWVGGRETYIATYLNRLKQQGFRASLIASSLIQDTPEGSIFDGKWVCGTDDYSVRWRNFLQKAHELTIKDRPSLIWAHHFDLFPAWLISRLHGIPLLTTFHGPLTGVGRPNDPMQALGMLLAIYHGDAVSSVSEEIASGIKQLNPEVKKIHVVPNSVEMTDAAWNSTKTSRPRKFVLITRSEKQQHMRKAVLLFTEFQKKLGRCSLSIALGETPNDGTKSGKNTPPNLLSRVKHAAKYLGGRWCCEQGPAFLLNLRNICFHGYVANPRDLIRESHVVLGMGRVLLEGLAEGRPSVLIGYEEICGLVTPKTFEQYRWSNFSGRGIQSETAAKVRNSILNFCENGGSQKREHLNLISVGRQVDGLRSLLEEVAHFRVTRDEEVNLAKKLAQDIDACRLKSEDIYSHVCKELSTRELASLYCLSVG